jgi:hypothetical protein
MSAKDGVSGVSGVSAGNARNARNAGNDVSGFKRAGTEHLRRCARPFDRDILSAHFGCVNRKL